MILLGKNVARLASGWLAARLISALALAAVAWLSTPADFARYSVAIAVALVLSVAVTLRYDAAIVAAATHAEASRLTRLSLALAAVIASILALAAWFAPSAWSPGPWLLPMIAASAFGRAAARAAMQWTVRLEKPEKTGAAMVAQALAQAAMQIGFLQFYGSSPALLLLADALGNLLLAFWLRRWIRRGIKVSPDMFAPVALSATVRKWSAMPSYNLPGALFNVLAVNLPMLAVPFVIPAAGQGGAALALRLLDMIAAFLGAVATPLLQIEAKQGNGGSRAVTRLLRKYFAAAALIYALAAAAAVSAAPQLPEFVMRSWLPGALPYILLFAALYALLAAGGPLIDLTPQTGGDRRALIVNAAFCAMALTSAWAAAQQQSAAVFAALMTGAAALRLAGIWGLVGPAHNPPAGVSAGKDQQPG